MKYVLILLTMMFGFACAQAHHGPDDHNTYTINPEKSSVTWTGKKVTGSHTGNITIQSGKVQLHGGALVEATITIDMTSITCTDIENEEKNAKLVGHLSSDDFFSVEAHNTSSFKATSIKQSDAGGYNVTGNLTIKGITNEITFPVNTKMTADGLQINGTMVFDRTKWKIQYGSGSFFDSLGDKAINDDVSLEFSLLANG